MGGTLVALAMIAILLLWGQTWGEPSSRPVSEGNQTATAEPRSAPVGGKESEPTTRSEDTRRQPVTGDPGQPGIQPDDTSLLLRVVDRATGEPVPRFAARLVPEGAIQFVHIPLHGVTNAEGEILWNDIEWERVGIEPPYPREFFTLDRGQRNEHVHEVDFSFTVLGVVVDSREQPVPGAEVYTVRDINDFVDQQVVAVADESGSFSFSVFSVSGPERVFVFARSPGRADSRVAMVGPTKGSLTVELRLGLGDEVGTIVGEVVTPRGDPIPDAAVLVRGSPVSVPAQRDRNMTWADDRPPTSPAARTDADGAFRFEDLPRGEARLKVDAEGWAGAEVAAEVLPGATTSVRIEMTSGGRIVGTVRTSDGDPLPGVTLVALRRAFTARSTVSDREGNYALETVQPGAVTLEAWRSPDDRLRPHRVELEDGQELRWDPVFAVGGSIIGVILDQEDDPLGETFVLVMGADSSRHQARTDTEGRFVAPDLIDQPYSISTYPMDFSRPVSLATDIRPGPSELELRLPPLPSVDAHLTGRVLGPGGEPIASARIFAMQTEWRRMVDQRLDTPDGRFRLGPILSGENRLTVQTADHPALERIVTLPPGETVDLGDLLLEQPALLEVAVRKPAEAQGFIWAYLWAGGVGGRLIEGEVESGRVILPLLRAGSYALEVGSELLPPEFREFELVAGRETRLEINLQIGLPRTLDVDLPDGIESTTLRFATFDSSDRELTSWHWRWRSDSSPRDRALRPSATRIVVTGENGMRGEAPVGSDGVIGIALRND